MHRIFRFSLRSRARIRSLSGAAVVVMGRLRSLLQGTRVTYITETLPISRSLLKSRRMTTNWDPYQKATDTAPSSVLWKPPAPLLFGTGQNDAPLHPAAEGTEELDRVYSTDSLDQFLASRPETGAPRCFYPFEMKTQEETSSAQRR